jgi:hypothetical protein
MNTRLTSGSVGDHMCAETLAPFLMKLPNLFAAQYLWEYHEPFVLSAARWIFYIVVFGGIALAICSSIWKEKRPSTNRPPPGQSPTVPAGQSPQNTQAASLAMDAVPDPRLIIDEMPPKPGDTPWVTHGNGTESGGAPANFTSNDASERLQKLNRLREHGLLSAELYESKRQEILQAL